MSFDGNPLIHFLKQNNVGGAVDIPPTPCLRAVYFADHAAAHVERTGMPRRHFSGQTGLVGRVLENPFICYMEGCL